MKYNKGPHEAAENHVLGASLFVDDNPLLGQEVFVGIVGSPVAKGKLKTINFDQAKKINGVVGCFTASDLAHNKWGPIEQDQPLLADDELEYLGEPVGLIAASDKMALKMALKAVVVDAEELPPTLSIDQAVENKEFLNESQKIVNGDVDSVFKKAPNLLEGCFRSGGQDHFYLESQAAIAYPKEGCIEILASSQHPTETQHVAAEALGLPFHKVVCRVKRMGGGFGGKESQASHVGALAALVAHRLNRPARLVFDKDTDMAITGKRHPYRTDYKVAFSDAGEILGLKAHFYADGGAYVDLSPAILQRTLLHSDNAYFLPAVDIVGQIVKTNTPPNTAFRGFGGPQGAAVIENIIEEIALKLKKDSLEVRLLNLYDGQNKNTTHYGQVVEANKLPQIFEKLKSDCRYEERQKEIENHNKYHPYLKRALSLTATKFGISFTSRFLNQGNALVNVHLDGTVQVSTGATEMGQGVTTKIQAIVAEAFGVKLEDVRVMETSTEKNHNTSATAASSGSDINGSAALIACEKIKSRIANIAVQVFSGKVSTPEKELEVDPQLDISDVVFSDRKVFLKSNTKKSIPIEELLMEMYMNRISLGDYGFYRTGGIGFNKETGRGTPFLYYTFGAAASEVQVDTLTGEIKVLRTDILMDLGRRLNEGVDFGQVSGAFIQGMGWATTEKLYYDKKGRLHSHSPTTYKIPNIQDTPRIFNIDFIENPEHKVNVRKSKAVGEPPFLLGLSVWTAVKKATAKDDSGIQNLPATNEEIVNYLNSGN